MDGAEWPSQPITKAMKRLLARFYTLVDAATVESSELLAGQVFGESGELVVNKRRMKGGEQIMSWPSKSSDDVVSRHHVVHKVYVCSESGDDLLMTGTLTMISSEGLVGETSYTARCVVDDAALPKPKVQLWQFWLDPTPFLDLGIMRPPIRKMSSGILDTIGGR
ncbi:hypothetical protein LTR35_004201 [Friedmanniomyces endolithicus]|nr:hypothetical protein LTR35_004201 [Friedmanniomyces endolithicus]KAK0294437.1 hypothetical protein LTS00_007028 [Friedmanniomyces endolithicus]